MPWTRRHFLAGSVSISVASLAGCSNQDTTAEESTNGTTQESNGTEQTSDETTQDDTEESEEEESPNDDQSEENGDNTADAPEENTEENTTDENTDSDGETDQQESDETEEGENTDESNSTEDEELDEDTESADEDETSDSEDQETNQFDDALETSAGHIRTARDIIASEGNGETLLDGSFWVEFDSNAAFDEILAGRNAIESAKNNLSDYYNTDTWDKYKPLLDQREAELDVLTEIRRAQGNLIQTFNNAADWSDELGDQPSSPSDLGMMDPISNASNRFDTISEGLSDMEDLADPESIVLDTYDEKLEQLEDVKDGAETVRDLLQTQVEALNRVQDLPEDEDDRQQQIDQSKNDLRFVSQGSRTLAIHPSLEPLYEKLEDNVDPALDYVEEVENRA